MHIDQPVRFGLAASIRNLSIATAQYQDARVSGRPDVLDVLAI
jgi:hypothetical protein